MSNVINTQIAIHTEYGGVVPEIASRKHIENINPVVKMALSDAGVTLDDITAIGVTYGPGLVGALLATLLDQLIESRHLVSPFSRIVWEVSLPVFSTG